MYLLTNGQENVKHRKIYRLKYSTRKKIGFSNAFENFRNDKIADDSPGNIEETTKNLTDEASVYRNDQSESKETNKKVTVVNEAPDNVKHHVVLKNVDCSKTNKKSDHNRDKDVRKKESSKRTPWRPDDFWSNQITVTKETNQSNE